MLSDLLKVLFNQYFENISDGQPSMQKVNWTTANDYCKRRNDSLLKPEKIINSGLSMTAQLQETVWLSAQEEYTPWMVYKGNLRH